MITADIKKPLEGRLKADPDRDLQPLMKESYSQAGQDLFVVALTQGKRQGRWLELGAGDPILQNNTYLLEKQFDWHGDSIEVRNPQHSDKQQRWQVFYSSVRGCFKDQHPQDWIDHPKDITDLSPQLQELFITTYNYHEVMSGASDQPKWLNPRRNWEIQRPGANLIIDDAITFDYSKLSGHYDYLQLDIDSGSGTVRCLKSVMKHHRPSVVTLEHDAFRESVDCLECRSQSRSIMQALGYELVANDVTCEPHKGHTWRTPVFFEDWYAHPDFIPMALIDAYRSVDYDLQPKYYHHILFI